MTARTHTEGVLEYSARGEVVLLSAGKEEVAILNPSGSQLPGAYMRGQEPPLKARANASRLAACWNCLQGLNTQQVERMGKLLDQYNSDELDILLTESGV